MFLHLCISHSLLSVNSDPLSPSPHLYNCQMKLVQFLLDIFLVDKANGSLAYNVLIQLRLMASVSCLPLSLSLTLTFAVSVCCLLESLVFSSLVSRLVSFFMSSVRQMSNGAARSQLAWKTLGKLLAFVSASYNIHTIRMSVWHIPSRNIHFHFPNACTARATRGAFSEILLCSR